MAALATLTAAPAADAAWEVERSWAVDGLIDLDVSERGDVRALIDGPGSTDTVRRYDGSGKQIASWSLPGGNAQVVSANGVDGTMVVDGDSALTAFDAAGRQTGRGLLQVGGQPLALGLGFAFDGHGGFYLSYLGGDNGAGVVRYAANGQQLAVWGGQGSAAGQFQLPNDVAVDGRGNVFVADAGNDRIQRFGESGAVTGGWGQTGTGKGQFRNPAAVAVDRSGDVWVLDGGLISPLSVPLRLQRFSADGRFRESVAVPTDRGPRGFGLAVDGRGRLVVGTGRGGVQGGVFVFRPVADGPRVASSSLRYRRGRIAVAVRCGGSRACRGTVRIKKGKATLGRRGYALKAGRQATVAVTPSASGRRVIARARTQRVTVQLKPSKGKAVSAALTLRR
ncbi:NHL repeat-containing protein [Patulibacter defluvii]|uniref:NHL repeat-containing protein n=1 Tax=Patulibacter defluvii TaxID=3095358 RepID=UPI002A75F91F|nr:NHL repeat-containing protein [Patulibacter sp. DM4]